MPAGILGQAVKTPVSNTVLYIQGSTAKKSFTEVAVISANLEGDGAGKDVW